MAFQFLEKLMPKLYAQANGAAAPPQAQQDPGLGAISKRIQGLYGDVNAVQAPTTLQTEDPTKAYTQKDYSGALPEFADARNQLHSTFARNRSTAQDELNRKFAGLGNLNSGAQIKQMENLDSELASKEGEANLGINMQEGAARRQLQQGEEAKSFQASQAATGRNFSREQYNSQIPFEYGQFKLGANSKLAGLDMSYQQMLLDKAQTARNMAVAIGESGDKDWLQEYMRLNPV